MWKVFRDMSAVMECPDEEKFESVRQRIVGLRENADRTKIFELALIAHVEVRLLSSDPNSPILTNR